MARFAENMAAARNVSFSFRREQPDGINGFVLSGINMEIRRGEFLALAGANGSGKSTLARLLNGLLLPDAGAVTVNGIDTRDRERIWEIRGAVGMVFQQPDNQIVGATVEEDAAFGPENLGLPPETVRARVRRALAAAGLTGLERRAPHLLSGGEKQRLALAGVLAMKPELLILDEATAMLDPCARRSALDILRRLNREEGLTVLLITSRMEEAALADRVMIMESGRIVRDCPPAELFSDPERLRGVGLELPPVAELFHLLIEDGLQLPPGISGIDEAATALSGVAFDGAWNVNQC
jgi:energy-coupling factor transport system ATP-binding protein